MNRPIRKVAIALGVLFAAIFVNLNFVQVVKSSDYRDHAGNQRVLLNEYASPRGQIVVQGTPIAVSKKTKDELKYLRSYPYGPIYAPVTGYYSFVYGRSGIEQAEDQVLSGNDERLFGTQLGSLLTGRNPEGGSVQLTLNKAAQAAAYSAMKGGDGKMRRGAVVALDPNTGAVLAAVSTPSYDPSALASHNSTTIDKTWKTLNDDPSQPMLNRAFNQVYAPGSVFKVIVSAAALTAGVKPTTRVPAANGYWPFDAKKTSACPTNNPSSSCVQNFDGETCDNGKTATLEFALAKSCNTAFAALTVDKLGGQKLAAQAQLFGLGAPYSGAAPDLCHPPQMNIPLPVCTSTVGSQNDLSDRGSLSHTSFGQQDVRITPLQAAMISSAVANNGTLMQPYLVAKELRPNLSTLHETSPTQLHQVIDPALDPELQSMMEGVITSPEGTGGSANITDIPGVVVGGKTGTADTGIFVHGKETPPHAWFTGFALENGTPKIAVAVIIENGGVNGNETTGGLAAAPVAKAVMEAYLKSGGGH
ncbi:MAG: peptidoglycan D,D-transpeptidase FtsI family protein [Jatrophihabitantaceae bacterium]